MRSKRYGEKRYGEKRYGEKRYGTKPAPGSKQETANHISAALFLGALFLLAVLAAGCDAIGEGPESSSAALSRSGQPAAAVKNPAGKAEAQEGEDLLIEAPGGLERAALYFEITSGIKEHPFYMDLVSRPEDSALARLIHTRTEEGKYQLGVDLTELGAEHATIELRDAGEVLYRREGVALNAEGTTRVGTLDRDPTSFHYKEDGEDVVIEVDYEDQAPNAPKTSPTRALVRPAFGETGPFAATHVAIIPEGVPPSQVAADAVALKGAEELTLIQKQVE